MARMIGIKPSSRIYLCGSIAQPEAASRLNIVRRVIPITCPSVILIAVLMLSEWAKSNRRTAKSSIFVLIKVINEVMTSCIIILYYTAKERLRILFLEVTMNIRKTFGVISGIFMAVSASLAGWSYSNSKVKLYSDGNWIGTGKGRNGPIEISITINDGKITDGKIISEQESDFAKPAAAFVIGQAIKQNKASGLDTVSGATKTSKGTAKAIQNALDKASAVK